MLLKTLKSNQTFHFLLIPLVAGALWIKSFLNPMLFPFYTGEDSMLLYQPINALIGKSTVVSNIFALIFIILLAFLILKLNVQYTFIRV